MLDKHVQYVVHTVQSVHLPCRAAAAAAAAAAPSEAPAPAVQVQVQVHGKRVLHAPRRYRQFVHLHAVLVAKLTAYSGGRDSLALAALQTWQPPPKTLGPASSAVVARRTAAFNAFLTLLVEMGLTQHREVLEFAGILA